MATYKKPLKYFDGITLDGYSFTAEDADGKRIGSYAIEAFEAHKTIKAEGEGKKVLVPFHAVKTAMYGIQTADAEKADAYCGGGTDGDTVTITLDGGDTGCTFDPMTVPKGEPIGAWDLPICLSCVSTTWCENGVFVTFPYTPTQDTTFVARCGN